MKIWRAHVVYSFFSLRFTIFCNFSSIKSTRFTDDMTSYKSIIQMITNSVLRFSFQWACIKKNRIPLWYNINFYLVLQYNFRESKFDIPLPLVCVTHNNSNELILLYLITKLNDSISSVI